MTYEPQTSSSVKSDNDCNVFFYFQNVIGHRCSWNTCLIIYHTNAAKNGAACRNTSQVVKLKIPGESKRVYTFNEPN